MNKLLNVKCIKTYDKYFDKDKTYEAKISGNNIMVTIDDRNTYIVAYNVLHEWYEDSWFKEHFVIG